MSSRCSPILNPNSTSINKNANAISSSSNLQLELSKILLQNDPNAIRLYDFINHATLYFYNSNECRWESNAFIDGNLFLYERKLIEDKQFYPSYAFAIINGNQKFIQEISPDMTQQSQNLSFFYEFKNDNQCYVFWLRFVNENECQRLSAFMSHAIVSIKKFESQQNLQQIIQKPNGSIPTNPSQQGTPCEIQNLNSTQVNNFSKEESNSNASSEDPTLSLKRLLNIQNLNGSNDELVIPQSDNSLKLIPPSAFAPTPSTNIVDNSLPLNRDQFRNILFDLVQNNDNFRDIIHQACQNRPIQ